MRTSWRLGRVHPSTAAGRRAPARTRADAEPCAALVGAEPAPPWAAHCAFVLWRLCAGVGEIPTSVCRSARADPHLLL
jgi:hypothetical protein